ncbi:PCDG2 protein, partial [Leptocoma aspasia]|nr:PCDG2 protein [Leptocoma aspasia]
RWGRRQRALLLGVLMVAWEAAWGQLRYSVPEEMPKGSFVGDVAKDLGLQLLELRDRGVRILNKGRTQYFALHGKTGHLVTAERIDREQLCRLVEKCVLRCELIVEGEMQVYGIEVEITDINDNAPSFRQAEKDLRLSETTAPGSRLDFEEGDSYELEVQAQDGGGLFDTAKVAIAVTDINDNVPVISVRSALSEISEDAPSGTVVALLHVQDRDSGMNGEVLCSLDGDVPFRLQSSHGSYYSVVTARELDREQVSEYNVTVRAADGGSPSLQSSAVLALRVLDVNDNAPVFAEERYSARLAENNAAGALVLTVRATDADWGQNARVRYRLSEGRVRGAPLSSYVSVQAETGALYALRSLDYEEVRELELWVRAEDGGAPALSSNVSVRLLIVDENDNAPQVLYPPPAAAAGSGAAWSGVELAPRGSQPGALPAGRLTRWLVLAVAAVSCLFLAFLLLLLALRLRRWRRQHLLPPDSGALRGVPVSHFVGIDGVRAFLQSYSHEVSLTADSRKSQLRFSGGSCCDTLPARPPPDEPAPLLGDEDPA